MHDRLVVAETEVVAERIPAVFSRERDKAMPGLGPYRTGPRAYQLNQQGAAHGCRCAEGVAAWLGPDADPMRAAAHRDGGDVPGDGVKT